MRTLLPVAAVAVAVAASTSQAQQAVTVTGQVTATGGQPLAAVQVFIPTLGVGGQTRDDGRFSFTAPARAAGTTVTVTARRIGYRAATQSVTLRPGSVSVSFALEAAATQLTGVVVSALGIQRERSQLGTAQQQVTNSELTQTKALNLVNQLQGKVSGVQITGSGTPGGSTNFIIRGQNSLAGNNQPLFVVDGIPVSNATRGGTFGNGYDYGNAISDLNPDDIATLTVLKGPNAAALYGSRASNGAVIITTKRGASAQGRAQTDFNTFVTFDQPSLLPKFQNQYGQGSGGEFAFVNGAGAGTNDGADQSYGPKLDGRLIDQFTGKQQPWVAHPNNVRDFFETGMTVSSTLGVSGGTERANARLSVGSDQIKGYVPNNSFRKFTTLLNGSLQVNPRLSTTATLQYARNSGINRPGTGYGNSILEQFFWFGRQIDLDALRDNRTASGATNGGPVTREYNWNYNYHNNPFWLQYSNPRRDNRDRFIGSLSATYRLAEGVNLLARTGSDIYRLGIEQDFSQGYINSTYVNTAFAGGFNFINDYRNENNSDLLLTADRTVLPKLRVTGTLGGNFRRETFNSNSQQSTGILVGGIYNVSNSAVAPTLGQTTTRRQVNGALGSAAFTYNNWLTVEGTARNDWSSTLPRGENSYFYPSASASVVLTDAVPAIKRGPLTYLKVRGASARVGNDADPYQLQTTYSGISTQFGGRPQFTLGNVLANAALKPEITRSDEAGLEFGLYNGRVTFDGSLYSRYTRNQIFNVAVSSASGFTNKAINAGRIDNKGVEALLTLVPVQRPGGFNWTTTFNFARNRNSVAELTPDVSSIQLSQGLFSDVSVEARAGQPFGIIRTPRLARDSAGRLLVKAGKPILEDTLSSFGSIQPRWTGGWVNSFSYKNLSLNTTIDVRRGGKIVSYSNYIGETSGVLESTLRGREVDFDNPGVVVQGIDVNTGKPNTTNVTSETYFQSLFGSLENYIYDGSFLRLREVRLGYEIPTRFIGRLNARSVGVALVGRNLGIKKNIPNVDPEFGYNTGNLQGIEYAVPANARSIGFNVRVTP